MTDIDEEGQLPPVAILRAAPTAELPLATLHDIRVLLLAAFEDDFPDDDWEHTIGGMHFIVEDAGSVVAHASVITRVLEVDSRPLRTGYVEGVATDPKHQRQGFGSLVMTAASDHIRAHYELGGLGTDLFSFYERFGWERWAGPTYVRRGEGLVHSKDEDGYVMVLRFDRTAVLDLSAPISCEERAGDDW